ncbi:MAG: S26 family signal peptidase [Candidatus Izemoplasmatales bacterium]|nr:S26 family signal peptidase [Candidatus Izemoplasmatales bacterium]
MKKILLKIFNILPFVFVAMAMALIVHLGLSLKKEQIPSVFNRAILYVKTPSMEDSIMAGDIIFVNVGDFEYDEEDIISFRKPDQQEVIITHRISRIDPITGLITTKGDNNLNSENWEINFSPDLIVGKYMGKSSVLGSVYEVLFVNSLNIVFLLMIIIFMLIGVFEIKNIVKLLTLKKQAELEEEKQKMIEEEKKKLLEEMKDKE